MLSARLEHLVDAGMLEARPYQEHPRRCEYVLTEMGRDLVPAIAALMAWGDRWTAGRSGPPARLRHDACGRVTTPVVACRHCGEPLLADELTVLAGPGGRAGPGTRVMAERLARR